MTHLRHILLRLRLVSIDPGMCHGYPHLTGYDVPCWAIAERAEWYGIAVAARDFGVPWWRVLISVAWKRR